MPTPYTRRALLACAAALTPTLSPPADAQGPLIVDGAPRTWAEAEAYAQSLGGHLVSINSEAENLAVRGLLGTNGFTTGYIGFTDGLVEGSFGWADGSPVTYVNWNEGEPNNLGDEDCTIQLDTALWNDLPCGVAYPGIATVVELPVGTMEPTMETALIFESTPRTWQEAQAYAESLGGNLVTINSAIDNAAVYALAGGTRAWIGFNDLASEGTFVWASGEPVSYTAWAGGEPNNAGEEDCTDIGLFGSQWNDAACSSLFPSVIELPALTGSLDYGTCSAALPAGRAACRVQASGTNNLGTGRRYTLFLRVAETGRVAFRGEVKPEAGESLSQLVKFVTVASDPASFTLELVAVEGSVEAPTGDAFVVDALDFTKGGPMLRIAEALTAFPNPAAGAATLRFAVAEQTEASLVVYDALGREVARPVEGAVSGVVEASVDASALPAGVYVARLVTAAGAETVRLTVVR